MHPLRSPSTLVAAAIGCALIAFDAAALAAPPTPNTLPPHLQKWLAAHARATARARQHQSTTAADTTAPALVAFDSEASVDVTRAGEELKVAFKAADDRSGVRFMQAYAYGPSGQFVPVEFQAAAPAKKVSGTMLSYSLVPYLEPGVYTFREAYVTDAAGNTLAVDQNALAALGHNTFVVKNKKGFDTSAPTLQRGQIQTPSLSLAAQHPGTDQPAYVAVSIDATDTGNGAVSGVGSGAALFCLEDLSACFNTFGRSYTEQGVPKASFTTGYQLQPWSDVPGVYHLYSLDVSDQAGNYLSLTSSQFGGETDFSAYFGSTTITLTP